MDPVAKEIIVRQGRLYTEKILSAIMEAGFDLKAIPSVIMGGGASILKRHVTPQDGLCRQVYLKAWEILQSVPDGQKSSYLVQVILKDQENNQLEKSIRQAIREELAGVSISGSGERVSKKEEIPSQMLDFLSGLEDAF